MYFIVQFLLDCEASRANYSVHSVSILQRNLGDVKRILIVDDSALIRRTLRSLLEGQYDWAICGRPRMAPMQSSKLGTFIQISL